MAARRFSRLQKLLLAWLALDEQRTRGMISSSHQELVGALQGDKSNISHSVHPRGPRPAGNRAFARRESGSSVLDLSREKTGTPICRKL